MPRKIKRTRKTKQSAGPRRDVIEAFKAKHGGNSVDDTVTKNLKRFTTTEDGNVDPVALKRLAQANGCWNAQYSDLNRGLARMTIGNKLRGLVRNGVKIKWEG